MIATRLPLLVEPAELSAHLGAPDLRIVDLNPSHIYARAHVPGAVSLDYGRIVAPRPPAAAVLPSPEQLSDTLGSIGLTPDQADRLPGANSGRRASRQRLYLGALEGPGRSPARRAFRR